MSKLYTPLQLGRLTLSNRVFMAPLSRRRSDFDTHTPNELMQEYYTQRASAGLVIAECTMIESDACAFYAEPGIFTDNHVKQWKNITNSVHNAGGHIFLQIIHGGRICPKEYNNNRVPVAPSAVPLPHRYFSSIQQKKVPRDTPREISDAEAMEIVKHFATAAKRAVEAGFDGVEIHAANGYLINQFLVPTVNKRTKGRYAGGSFETRAQFALDIVDACIDAIGRDRVGIRLSPYVVYNEAKWENPEEDLIYMAKQLEKRGVVYIHLIRRDLKDFNKDCDNSVDATPLLRKHFSGVIVSNADLRKEESESIVDSGVCDAVAIGNPYIANPDLVRRFQEGRELNEVCLSTVYTPGPKGYTDYPFLKD